MKENTVSTGYPFLAKCFQVWYIYGSNLYEMNHTGYWVSKTNKNEPRINGCILKYFSLRVACVTLPLLAGREVTDGTNCQRQEKSLVLFIGMQHCTFLILYK